MKRSRPITLSIRPARLAEIDRSARAAGMSRSAFLAWRGIRNACIVAGVPAIDEPSREATDAMAARLA